MIRTRLFSSALEVTVLMAAGLAMFLPKRRPCQAAPPSASTPPAASPTAEGSCGSGCVFEIGNGSVYVLTAGHVTGNAAAVQCEFWRQGTSRPRWPAAWSPQPTTPMPPWSPCRWPRWAACCPPPSRWPRGPKRSAPGDTLAVGRLRQRHLVHRLERHMQVEVEADGGEELHFVPPPANGTERLGPVRRRGQAYRRRHHRADRRWAGEGIATPIAAVYRAFDVDARCDGRLRR